MWAPAGARDTTNMLSRNGIRSLLQKLPAVTPATLSALTAIFVVATGNAVFFRLLTAAYPAQPGNLPALASVFFLLLLATTAVFLLFAFRGVVKPALCAALLLAAAISHFTDRYGLVFDETMLGNILKTDRAEALDLMGRRLLLSLSLFGALPAGVVAACRLKQTELRGDFGRAAVGALSCLVGALLIVACFSQFYASFFREHKSLRSYANPLYSFYSAGKLASRHVGSENAVAAPFGRDARVTPADDHRELIILVLGETARTDRFSLNGYERETNPLLKREDVLSFRDFTACGTSTAVSVPCIFSGLGRAEYTDRKARERENLLDMLVHTNRISVLWRDNNSDSKGVADRIGSEDFRDPRRNPICDPECRDVGMLDGLQEYVNQQTGDVLIVLHQMGNHGPAYYKRYPESFEKFRPACRSNEFEKCSREEINNAYDNAILYTDYFLSRVIDFLKKNSDEYEAGMIYVSDHGESLGEKGIFLHGLPYFLAPPEQKQVPMVVWFNDKLRRDHPYESLRRTATKPASHDNLFHSLLGLLEVETALYQPNLDLFREAADE